MMRANAHIIKLGHIARGIDARNIGLQVFIGQHSTAYFHRRTGEDTGIERNAEANADQIGLDLATAAESDT